MSPSRGSVRVVPETCTGVHPCGDGGGRCDEVTTLVPFRPNKASVVTEESWRVSYPCPDRDVFTHDLFTT